MITQSQIDGAFRRAAALPVGKKIEIKDDGEQGAGRLALILRRGKNEVTAHWFALWWRSGRRQYTKIKSYSEMSLKEARAAFRAEYSSAISLGADPALATVRNRLNDAAIEPTLEAMFKAYVANLKATGKRSAERVERILINGEEPVAKVLGGARLAASVTTAEIVMLLKQRREHGVDMAASIRKYLNSAFNFGLKSENNYTVAHAGQTWRLKLNPVAGIPSDPEANKPGTRFLTPEEFNAYWHWCVSKRETSLLSFATLLNMATGQRIEEILKMAEPGYDSTMRTFYWAETKNEKPHLIPLPQVACDILDELKPIGPNKLYFPNKLDPSRPATADTILWLIETFAEETEAEYFTNRDIRRTWKTLTGRAGVTKEMRDKLQNHAQHDVGTKHYDRYDYLAEKRLAMAKWESFMNRIISGDFGDDVVVPFSVAVA